VCENPPSKEDNFRNKYIWKTYGDIAINLDGTKMSEILHHLNTYRYNVVEDDNIPLLLLPTLIPAVKTSSTRTHRASIWTHQRFQYRKRRAELLKSPILSKRLVLVQPKSKALVISSCHANTVPQAKPITRNSTVSFSTPELLGITLHLPWSPGRFL